MSLNKFETLQAIRERESSVVNSLFSQLADAQRTAPEYFAYFEDANPDTATRADLVDLMASAPNDRVKFYLLGRFISLVSLAAVTGRAV